MAYEIPVFDIGTLVAGADLSAAQYRFVKTDANGQVVLAGAGEPVTGVLQNKPAAGQAAQVRIYGVTKVVAGGAVGEGTLVAADASAKAVAATVTTADTTTGALTGSHVAGIALGSAGAADEIVSVALLPMGAVPGTSA